MDCTSAAKLMAEHRLIARDEAKTILEAVAAGRWGSIAPTDELLDLRARYLEVVQERLAEPPAFPRNLPFYLMVRDRFPEFRWEVFRDAKGLERIRFENMPMLGKLIPSLLSLLLGRIPASSSRTDELALQLAELPPHVVDALRHGFERMAIARPTPGEIDEIGGWLRKGLDGEELTIFTPICPDYAYEETGDPCVPYRVTFDGLGSGIGIVAGRALVALPLFVGQLRECGLRVRSVVGSGDFEAFSAANLARLRLTEQEFLDKLRTSSRAFEAACPVEIDQRMIAELCGGRREWNRMLHEAHAKLTAGDYGASGLTPKSIREILMSRMALYQTWFGLGDSPQAYLGALLAQGAEYAVMGRMLAERVVNPLVLGADHPAMRPFYRLHQRIPTVYLRRVY